MPTTQNGPANTLRVLPFPPAPPTSRETQKAARQLAMLETADPHAFEMLVSAIARMAALRGGR